MSYNPYFYFIEVQRSLAGYAIVRWEIIKCKKQIVLANNKVKKCKSSLSKN